MLRKGFTVVELLIVISIVAILIGLLLVAIQRTRNAATRTDCTNRMHQFALAIAQFESAHPGNLPSSSGDKGSSNNNMSLHMAIAPYLEITAIDAMVTIKSFLCPEDPTDSKGSETGFAHRWSSYAANGMVFNGIPKVAQITDGLSQTIAVAEHYGYLCRNAAIGCQEFSYLSTGAGYQLCRPTFADAERGDVIPETSGIPPRSNNSFGLTFQLQPMLNDCDPRLAQTPHAGGMNIALCDGSVRSISRTTAREVYWDLVTPSGGENIGEY